MNTAARAQALADACAGFRHLLGPTSAADLLDLVALDLGHPAILDSFQPAGSQFLQAVPPGTILHILAGNTPHAALQSLVRGLLLGSHNLCKLPSGGLPEAESFAAALPAGLRSRIEFARSLPDSWLPSADAVIVFGSDETIAHFRGRVLPHQVFIPYGHRVSLGIVFGDPSFESAPLAALDTALSDQQGCLSPHGLYVGGQPREYAARLAEAMQRIEASSPRAPISLSEAAAIAELRDTTRFRAAIGQPVQLWESPGSDAWTVIFDPDPLFTLSPLNRVLIVRPLPASPSALADAIAPARPFLSTIAIWPDDRAHAETAAGLGASRICPIGSMQFPSWSWRHDGRPTLSPLVSWRTWESHTTPHPLCPSNSSGPAPLPS